MSSWAVISSRKGNEMKIHSDINLSKFEFWSGAKDTAEYLTNSEFDIIEDILTELYPEGLDETTINDIFWFEHDTIAEWLGYNSFEEIMERED